MIKNKNRRFLRAVTIFAIALFIGTAMRTAIAEIPSAFLNDANVDIKPEPEPELSTVEDQEEECDECSFDPEDEKQDETVEDIVEQDSKVNPDDPEPNEENEESENTDSISSAIVGEDENEESDCTLCEVLQQSSSLPDLTEEEKEILIQALAIINEYESTAANLLGTSYIINSNSLQDYNLYTLMNSNYIQIQSFNGISVEATQLFLEGFNIQTAINEGEGCGDACEELVTAAVNVVKGAFNAFLDALPAVIGGILGALEQVSLQDILNLLIDGVQLVAILAQKIANALEEFVTPFIEAGTMGIGVLMVISGIALFIASNLWVAIVGGFSAAIIALVNAGLAIPLAIAGAVSAIILTPGSLLMIGGALLILCSYLNDQNNGSNNSSSQSSTSAATSSVASSTASSSSATSSTATSSTQTSVGSMVMGTGATTGSCSL